MKTAFVPVCDWINCVAKPDLEVQTDDDWQPMCREHAFLWIEICKASADPEGRALGEVSPRPLRLKH